MVKKWDIYYVDLDPTLGSEQSGTRPVLVISNDAVNTNLPVCTIIPFSSYRQGVKIYPTEMLLSMAQTGLPKDSILMLQQIRTIASSRLRSAVIGTISDDSVKEQINRALMDYFEL